MVVWRDGTALKTEGNEMKRVVENCVLQKVDYENVTLVHDRYTSVVWNLLWQIEFSTFVFPFMFKFSTYLDLRIEIHLSERKWYVRDGGEEVIEIWNTAWLIDLYFNRCSVKLKPLGPVQFKWHQIMR